VYALRLTGSVAAVSDSVCGGGCRGRLAVYPELLTDTQGRSFVAVAAGGDDGSVSILEHLVAPSASPNFPALPGWPQRVGANPFTPDFLFIDFAGRPDAGTNPTPVGGDCFEGALSLIVHHADRLWAYCLNGGSVPGWGGARGDTLVAGLGAGDPDGDGFPEVLTQSIASYVSYWDVDGHPSPGWPRSGTPESFRSSGAPLAVDLDGGGRTHTIAMNASGIVDAFDGLGRQAVGWPLASGLGATGSPLIADLNGDHLLELVVADARGLFYAYSLPTPESALVGVSWPMLGGDAQRSSGLPAVRTPVALAPAAGPLVRGSLKAYPNPAIRKPVSFAYRMSEPGEVDFRILDTSGHEVASFTRRARQADNVEVWDPGALPAGLYVARLRFKGATSNQVETVPLGLLR
jgi:hypothetical protein